MSRTVVNQELNEQEIRVNRENILIGGGAVNSVNGQTGDVVLTAQDVGAASTTELGNEVEARIAADNGLQSQIDGLAAASDVTDIVGTYADLQAYDTSKLNDNDIIKVLQDEQHDDETTYYRWSTDTESFTLIGEEGPYYTKSAADTKFQEKLVAGTNITIDPSTNEISASASGLSDSTTFWGRTASNGKVGGKLDVKYSENDTSYVTITPTNTHSMSITQTSGGSTHTLVNFGASNTPATFYEGINANSKKITNVATPTAITDAANKDYVDGLIPSDFTGTDGVDAGTAGLVPAPATTDVGKFLKSDGTWGTAGGGGDIPVYVYKLSEMRHETYSGGEYYALPNGIDDFKTGIYYFLNDTGTNIGRSIVRFTIFLPSENPSHYGGIWAGSDYGVGQILDGQYESVTIHITSTYSSSPTSVAIYYVIEEAAGYNSTNVVTGAIRYLGITYNPSTGLPINSNIYETGNRALITSSDLTRSSSAYNSHALSLSGANTLYRTIRGDTGSNSVRAWTSIGTGSQYTKRALQTTLNIAETGLTGLTANDWNTLFTLPANYYPNAQLATGCTMLDNGVLVNGLVRVTTAGAVQVYAGANTTEVYGLLTMPVAS